jgi:leader peptidase (prepilin peptidase)/N-methyltransferase
MLDMIIASLSGGGILLLLAILTKGGMGGGDIKFVAALGLWLGLKLTLLTLFLSFVIGGIGSLMLLAFKIKGRKDFIPFGPFIAIAAFISMLYGNEIIAWYLSLL